MWFQITPKDGQGLKPRWETTERRKDARGARLVRNHLSLTLTAMITATELIYNAMKFGFCVSNHIVLRYVLVDDTG